MSKITNLHYEYSISIKDFDTLLYEILDDYIDYVTLPSAKLSVSRYRNPNTNINIINDRIVFNNNLYSHNIIDILDDMKINININPYLPKHIKIIKHIYKMIKFNCRLEQIIVIPAIK